VGGQRHARGALTPGKTRYPFYMRLYWPQDRSGRVRKISPHTGIRSPDGPTRSESLYRLSFSGSHIYKKIIHVLKAGFFSAGFSSKEDPLPLAIPTAVFL